MLTLCDALVKTQITNKADSNYGALVCPSENPENHPIHSRAAESVYPFAIAYKLTGKPIYREAALIQFQRCRRPLKSISKKEIKRCKTISDSLFHNYSGYFSDIPMYFFNSVCFSACFIKKSATSALLIPPIFIPLNN